MTKAKKISCIILAVIVVAISLFCTPLIFKKDVSAVSGNWRTYTAILDGSNGVYTISNAKQLSYFNENMSTYKASRISLVANIDMSEHYWTPKQSYFFAGVFEGNNHTISGLYIDGVGMAGLFSKIDYGGQVANLNLKNVYITNATGYAGSICGYLEGSNGKEYNINNCNISNCNITYKGTNNEVFIGGVAGFTYSSIIKNCYLFALNIVCGASKPTTAFVGGIAGEANNSYIYGCCYYRSYRKDDGDYVFDKLNAIATTTSFCGGIVGRLNYKNSKTSTNIDSCYINEAVIVSGDSETATAYAGGIAGAVEYGNITNCRGYCPNAYAKVITYESESGSSIKSNYRGKRVWDDWSDCYIYDDNSNGMTYTQTRENVKCGGIAGRLASGCKISNCYVPSTPYVKEAQHKLTLTLKVKIVYWGTYWFTDVIEVPYKTDYYLDPICDENFGTVDNCYVSKNASSEIGEVWTIGGSTKYSSVPKVTSNGTAIEDYLLLTWQCDDRYEYYISVTEPDDYVNSVTVDITIRHPDNITLNCNFFEKTFSDADDFSKYYGTSYSNELGKDFPGIWSSSSYPKLKNNYWEYNTKKPG